VSISFGTQPKPTRAQRSAPNSEVFRMADDQASRTDSAGVERPAEVEPRIGDQRPRERRINKHVRLLGIAGSLVGAVVFAVMLWLIGLVSGRSGGLMFYLFAIGLGLIVGAMLLPYLTLARADGGDARLVSQRARIGRADAPIEGAQQVDNERAVTRAKAVRRHRKHHQQ
jgi:hypothetical protein